METKNLMESTEVADQYKKKWKCSVCVDTFEIPKLQSFNETQLNFCKNLLQIAQHNF